MPKVEANIPLTASVQNGEKLPIMEAFYTLQGEGHFAGQAAYFVRLAGCDVGCVWCDVKESWDAALHPVLSVERIVDEAAQYPARIVVVTGGEPLMYNLDVLTKAFKDAGFRTHIETSGAYPLTGDWDWITFSPKKFKAPLPEVAEKAHELKTIIFNKSDFEFAAEHTKSVNSSCLKYLQAEWSKKEKVNPLIVDFVKDNPDWRVSVQTHKYLNIP